MKHRIKLKDVASFSKGQQINGDELLPHGEYAYLNGGINPSGRWSEYNVEGNTVTVSEGGNSSGYINFMESPFWCGARCYYLFDINGNSKYLYYALKSQQDRVMSIRSGACMPNIKKADLGNFELYFDDDGEEQQDVVVVLDRISSIIEARKQQLFELDNLVKARFVEMFGDFKTNTMGWPMATFDEIAVIDGNMTTDYQKYADYPHIGIDSIEKETGLLKGYRTVSEDGVISGKYIFTPHHIIYSKIRPNLNKVALPDFYGVCSADAYPILPIDEKCNRIFLAYDMRSTFFWDYILQFCNRTNLPKVNRKEVSGFRTPLPPLELQDEFADFVTQVDKAKVVVQKALDEAQTLFNSLMQEYFG